MNQVTTYRERREVVVARAYAAGGCPIHVGKLKCGETKGLDIIMDFHKLYQEKMSQIDVSAGGDTLQAKVDLQQEWINDLTEQNRMLAKVIEELESEAIGRVTQLEEKLKTAAKSFGEDEGQALADRDKKIKELEEALTAIPVVIDSKKPVEDERPTKVFEDSFADDTTICLLRHEICRLEEKNIEIHKEACLKDDIIKELRKELKRSRNKIPATDTKRAIANFKMQNPETSEKGVNTTDSTFLAINHEMNPQDPNNSTVIFIHRGQTEEKTDGKRIFESSDSSECSSNQNFQLATRTIVHPCKSENDVKPIKWIRPTKDRSKLTRIHGDDDGDRIRLVDQGQNTKHNLKKLNIPKHIPVKTYVNNIEYVRDVQ